MALALGIALLGGSALVAGPGSAGAELKRVEAVGAVPVEEPAAELRAIRGAALRAGLREAVHEVGRDLLSEAGRQPGGFSLDRILGAEPLDYTSRFQILEDYGERPSQLVPDSRAETEYVVLVEAYVDAGRLREKLAEAGLLARRTPVRRGHQMRVVLEPLGAYSGYAWLLDALARDARVAAAVPEELERGRAVLLVDTDLAPGQVLNRLRRAAPEWIQIVSAAQRDGQLVLRLRAETPPAKAVEAPRD